MPTNEFPTAEPLEADDIGERRSSARHVCEIGGQCQPVTALEAGNHWPIKTLDLSSHGVGLLMSRRFEPGTLLAVTLSGPGSDDMSMPLARVCRVDPAGHHWLLGCSWADELESTDLATVLRMPTRAWVAVKKG